MTMHRGQNKKWQRELIYHEDFVVWIRTFARKNRQWLWGISLQFLHRPVAFIDSQGL